MGSSVRLVKRECIPGGESQLEWRPQMMYRIAFPLLASAVASGCSGKDSTGPRAGAAVPGSAASSRALLPTARASDRVAHSRRHAL
jgi:hypothetical protein